MSIPNVRHPSCRCSSSDAAISLQLDNLTYHTCEVAVDVSAHLDTCAYTTILALLLAAMSTVDGTFPDSPEILDEQLERAREVRRHLIETGRWNGGDQTQRRQ